MIGSPCFAVFRGVRGRRRASKKAVPAGTAKMAIHLSCPALRRVTPSSGCRLVCWSPRALRPGPSGELARLGRSRPGHVHVNPLTSYSGLATVSIPRRGRGNQDNPTLRLWLCRSGGEGRSHYGRARQPGYCSARDHEYLLLTGLRWGWRAVQTWPGLHGSVGTFSLPPARMRARSTVHKGLPVSTAT